MILGRCFPIARNVRSGHAAAYHQINSLTKNKKMNKYSHPEFYKEAVDGATVLGDGPGIQDGNWMSYNANGAKKFTSTLRPICPHCGAVTSITEKNRGITTTGTHEIECFFCESDYRVKVQNVTFFSTGPEI